MTAEDACDVVAGELVGGFRALPVLLDDNTDPGFIPDSGGVRLVLSSGSEVPYASSGVYEEPLVFTAEISTLKGSGRRLAQRHGETIRAIFRGRTLLAPNPGGGHLLTTRTQSDFLGIVKTATDGREFYRVNAVLVFKNLSYH